MSILEHGSHNQKDHGNWAKGGAGASSSWAAPGEWSDRGSFRVEARVPKVVSPDELFGDKQGLVGSGYILKGEISDETVQKILHGGLKRERALVRLDNGETMVLEGGKGSVKDLYNAIREGATVYHNHPVTEGGPGGPPSTADISTSLYSGLPRSVIYEYGTKGELLRTHELHYPQWREPYSTRGFHADRLESRINGTIRRLWAEDREYYHSETNPREFFRRVYSMISSMDPLEYRIIEHG